MEYARYCLSLSAFLVIIAVLFAIQFPYNDAAVATADMDVKNQKQYCVYQYNFSSEMYESKCYSSYNKSRNALYDCHAGRGEFCHVGFGNSTFFVDERGCLWDNTYGSCSRPYESNKTKTVSRDEHYRYVGMIKGSTGQIVNVFPSSLEKLMQRGWGTLGSTWNPVCDDFTAGDDSTAGLKDIGGREFATCLLTSSPLDVCKSMNDGSPVQCIEFNIKPRTIDDCKDMFHHGYLYKFFGESTWNAVSLQSYAIYKCDLYPKAFMHDRQCQDWWSHYERVSQNHYRKISEKPFIVGYCLVDKEPDWERLDLHGCFVFPHIDKKQCGHISDFKNTLKKRCVEHSCHFYHHGGLNSTFQCPEAIHSGMWHSLELNSQTGSSSNSIYECVADYYYLYDPWKLENLWQAFLAETNR